MSNPTPDMPRRSSTALWVVLGLAFVCVAALGVWRWALPRSPLVEGQSAYHRAHWESAERFSREALRNSISDRNALRLLARSTARLGRDDAAQKLFRQLGASDAEAEDLFLLGSILVRQRDDGQAMLMLERAKSVDPRHAETLLALARIYLRLEFPRSALESAQALAALSVKSTDAQELIGRASEAIGDAEGATKAYRAWLAASSKAASDLPEISRRLARVLLQQNQPDEALEALAAAPADPESIWLRSRAMLQRGDLVGLKPIEAETEAYREAHPTEPEPARYIGSAACQPCHVNIAKAHASSHHFHTFARSDELIGKINEQPTPRTDPTDARLAHRIINADDRVKVEVSSGQAVADALAAYALGSGNRGRSMIVRQPSGLAREYRLTHYAKGVGWDLTMHHPEHPPSLADALGQPLIEDSVRACVNCHVTDAFAAELSDSPIRRETGIGCERCHGPGGNHIKAVEYKMADWAIVRPQLAPVQDRVLLCSQCHKAPRGDSTIAPDSVRFPWPKLGQSRCFTESGGALDCVTCHNPHRDVSVAAATYDAKCLSCHSGKPLASIARAPATCTENHKSDCLPCHMPRVPNAIPHTSFTDHFIRVRKGSLP